MAAPPGRPPERRRAACRLVLFAAALRAGAQGLRASGPLERDAADEWAELAAALDAEVFHLVDDERPEVDVTVGDSELKAATHRLKKLPEFQRAKWVHADRGRRFRDVRLATLSAQKMLLVPMEAGGHGSAVALLDPSKFDAKLYRYVVTSGGLARLGEPVGLRVPLRVELLALGSSLVDPITGARRVDGRRAAGREFALLRALRAIDDATVVVTVVGDAQVVEEMRWPEVDEDSSQEDPSHTGSCEWLPAHVIVTPTRTIHPMPRTRGAMAPCGNAALSLQSTDDLLAWWRAKSDSKAFVDAERRGRLEVKAAVQAMVAKRSKSQNIAGQMGAATKRFVLSPVVWSSPCVSMSASPSVHHEYMRRAVLTGGHTIVVAPPGLPAIFVIDPARVPKSIAEVATLEGIETWGERLDMRSPPQIGLVVLDSIAVDPDSGMRVGPFSGEEELVYSILRHIGAVDDRTTVLTLVSEPQVISGLPIDNRLCHDVPVDIILTKKRERRVQPMPRKPLGVYWHRVAAEDLERLPLLRAFRAVLEADLGLELPIEPALTTKPKPAPPRMGKGGRPGKGGQA